jgi:hypothetical protein
MAKALIGHLPSAGFSQAPEIALLRRRVAELEALVTKLSSENDSLVAAYLALRPADDDSLLTREHAAV